MVVTILIPVQNCSCYFFSCDNFNHVYLDVCGFLLEVYVFFSALVSDLITWLSSSRIRCTGVYCFLPQYSQGIVTVILVSLLGYMFDNQGEIQYTSFSNWRDFKFHLLYFWVVTMLYCDWLYKDVFVTNRPMVSSMLFLCIVDCTKKISTDWFCDMFSF